jgi:hypothetical protein
MSSRLCRRVLLSSACILCACSLLFADTAVGTPSGATWYRERLLGENGSHYFVLVSLMVNEGTYDRYRESQQVQRIDKRSGRKVDSVLVRSVEFLTDANTSSLMVREDSLPAFDLAGYLRKHGTSAPYSPDLEDQADLDSTGLYFDWSEGREILVPMAAIRERFLPSREGVRIELLGVEFTQARPDSGLSRMTYYTIRSHPAGDDIPSSEIVIMVAREAR